MTLRLNDDGTLPYIRDERGHAYLLQATDDAVVGDSDAIALFAFDGTTFTITVGAHVFAIDTSGVMTLDGLTVVRAEDPS